MTEKKCARDGTYVRVHLEGRLESGEEVVNRDISLTLGRGHAYRCFEEAVHGLQVGESRTVKMRVPANERALISHRNRSAEIGNDDDPNMYVALNNGMVAKKSNMTLDCNDQLAGRVMEVSVTLNSMDGRQLPALAGGNVWAIFSGGSFLSTEAVFSAVPGVQFTRVGYAGGMLRNAEYTDVMGRNSGHFESVAIAYDPSIVYYEELLDIYAAYIYQDKASGVDVDIGAQYGKAIFCTDKAQFDTACKWRANLNAKTGRKLDADLRRIEVGEMVVAEDMFQRCV